MTGLSYPEENWHRIPNDLTSDILASLSRTEILVLLYLIRHLWGWGEDDSEDRKRISNDEFINGRMKKGGTRIDSGIGVSRSVLAPAIQSLIENGYIIREVDDTDKGRVKHYYRIVERDQGPEKRAPDAGNQGPEKRALGARKTGGGARKTGPDHKKETSRKKQKKDVETKVSTPSPLSSNGSSTNGFDKHATKHLMDTLTKAGVKFPANAMRTWPNQFRLLREADEATKDDIKKVLTWYREYYPSRKGQEFVPVAHSASAFRRKFFEKLLPQSQIKPKQVINGYQLLTAQDVAKAQERNAEFCLNDDRPWVEYGFDFDAYESSDELTQRKMIANHVNRFIKEGWDIADDLRHVGLGYLVKKQS